MRTYNSIKNISIGISTQVIITLLGFISRKVFLDNLGVTYLGVNGLLTNVLSLLGLLEAGIGTSIVYNLYKPLAENDETKVTILMKLYKKAYIILAMIVFLLSIILYPLITKMMNSSDGISDLTVIYMIFVIKNVLAYLYSYKWCIINADQKGYILAKRNMYFSISTTIIKIIILTLTKNYILYLLMEIIIMIIQNITNGRIVDKRYAYIKNKVKINIDKDVKSNIVKNVKALFLHNIGGFCVFGTDNILISKFINIATVGIYSNYSMVIGHFVSIVSPIIGGLGNSVGNLLATENEEKIYSIFNTIYFVNFWMYSFCVIFLYNLLNPFIVWWIGTEYLLDKFTFVIILLNCYITGLRSSILTFKTKAGIFDKDKYIPLVEAIVNLGASLILVKYLGISGIFLGTTLSTLSIVFWNAPRLVFKYVFNKPVNEYFKKYIMYFLITIVTGSITTYICNIIIIRHSFFSLVIRGIICVIIPNLIYLLIFFKTKEFRALLEIFNIHILKRYNLIKKKSINNSI